MRRSRAAPGAPSGARAPLPRTSSGGHRRPDAHAGTLLHSIAIGLRNRRPGSMLLATGRRGRPEVTMRKLAIAFAVVFAAVSARTALACEDKVQTAEQPQQKPAVAA